jgi:hypothetical protein
MSYTNARAKALQASAGFVLCSVSGALPPRCLSAVVGRKRYDA